MPGHLRWGLISIEQKGGLILEFHISTHWQGLLGLYKLDRGFVIQKQRARGGYKMYPPFYKNKNLNSFKHRHVAYQNDRIEMLITNLKTVLKNIAPSSNKISLST